METRTEQMIPFFRKEQEFELQIGTTGQWRHYLNIKTQSDMDFSVLKCRLMPYSFRIIKQSSKKVVYGCGAE